MFMVGKRKRICYVGKGSQGVETELKVSVVVSEGRHNKHRTLYGLK